ncbi:MAG: GNAT family N-acetyltransferase [Candidatus Izemoplasmataceae bacterium]
MRYSWIHNEALKQQITKEVLDDLPEWFGIEEATQMYIDHVKEKPFLAVYDADTIVGFYALREENRDTLDMYVLGVKKAYHAQGIGAQLQTRVDTFAKEKGYRFLIVLTLSKSRPNQAYAKTRAFYERMGFRAVYENENIWDPSNPAELYIKVLNPSDGKKGHPIEIETERLKIRPYAMSDLDAMHRIFSDASVMAACEPPYSKEKSESTLRRFVDKRIAYAVELKNEKRVIGHLLFKPMPSEAKGIYEIGWIFNKTYWRKGYASEAAKAMIRHGFEQLNLHKVVAETIDDEKALPMMKRLGMHHEATMRKHVLHEGRWKDLHLAGILAEDEHLN